MRRGVWGGLMRSPTGAIGLVCVLIVVLTAVFAPWIAPAGPLDVDVFTSLEGPSLKTPFGRDSLGRDILSRVVYGARLSLLVSLGSVVIGVLVAVPLGVLAGFFGGRVDAIIRSVADLLLAFPPFLLALSLVAIIGVGIQTIVLSVAVSTMPMYIRLIRSEVLSVRQMEYVTAAQALGRSPWAIMFRHVLPNVFSLVIVQSTLYMGVALLYSAGLGFLGLGVQPPTPEWGAMLGDGRTYVYSAPHLTIFPGLAIFFTILGFNLLGDGLRDVLDPKLRGRG